MATKKCKTCGREYEYCHTAKRIPGLSRWQDVACSIECGSAYFALVEAARAEKTPENLVVVDEDIQNDEFACEECKVEYDPIVEE